MLWMSISFGHVAVVDGFRWIGCDGLATVTVAAAAAALAAVVAELATTVAAATVVPCWDVCCCCCCCPAFVVECRFCINTKRKFSKLAATAAAAAVDADDDVVELAARNVCWWYCCNITWFNADAFDAPPPPPPPTLPLAFKCKDDDVTPLLNLSFQFWFKKSVNSFSIVSTILMLDIWEDVHCDTSLLCVSCTRTLIHSHAQIPLRIQWNSLALFESAVCNFFNLLLCCCRCVQFNFSPQLSRPQ